MKAIVQERYGSPDVLELREIDKPEVGDDEVLVRVRAASVHADVWHAVHGVPYVLRIMGSGLRAPKRRVPGTDLAGHIESVGRNVTRFRAGDEVFGQTLGANLWSNGGAYAAVLSGHESGALPLNVGWNSLDVLVTAQNGKTKKTYKLTVERDAAGGGGGGGGPTTVGDLACTTSYSNTTVTGSVTVAGGATCTFTGGTIQGAVIVYAGESVWLEGVALIGLYGIIAASFWWG